MTWNDEFTLHTNLPYWSVMVTDTVCVPRFTGAVIV